MTIYVNKRHNFKIKDLINSNLLFLVIITIKKFFLEDNEIENVWINYISFDLLKLKYNTSVIVESWF